MAQFTWPFLDQFYWPFTQAAPDTNIASSVDEKFTGQKRDNETGLDYFGARYYSSPLGRFTSPDPLYVEANRLGDPKQLNLYAYVRNNPLKLVDPIGMYIEINCGIADDCVKAIGMFNNRGGAQFTVGWGNNNKLAIIDAEKKLSKAEKTLYKAITNESKGGVLNISRDTGTADFGVYNNPGSNTIDLGNLAKLDAPSNSGGIGAGDIVAHEGLESYFSSSMQKSSNPFEKAHNKVLNRGLPGLKNHGGKLYFDSSRGNVLGVEINFTFSGHSGSMIITTKLITPIPVQSLSGHSVPEIESIIKGSKMRIDEVKYVP